MESTILARGAVVSVAAAAVQSAATRPVAVIGGAGVAVASHLRDAVRPHGVGRGMWRSQPSLGVGASAPTAAVASAVIARISKLDRTATKQFRSTVYDGPRPWKVPV